MGYYSDLDAELGHDEEARAYFRHRAPRRPSSTPKKRGYTRCSECDYWTPGKDVRSLANLKTHQSATGHVGEGRTLGDVKPGSKGPKK